MGGYGKSVGERRETLGIAELTLRGKKFIDLIAHKKKDESNHVSNTFLKRGSGF